MRLYGYWMIYKPYRKKLKDLPFANAHHESIVTNIYRKIRLLLALFNELVLLLVLTEKSEEQQKNNTKINFKLMKSLNWMAHKSTSIITLLHTEITISTWKKCHVVKLVISPCRLRNLTLSPIVCSLHYEMHYYSSVFFYLFSNFCCWFFSLCRNYYLPSIK